MSANILIAYYSHSGNTHALANKLGQRLGADMLRIQPKTPFRWPFGIIRAGHMSVHGETQDLQPADIDPAPFDMVIVGTPVWARHVSPPTRSWLVENKTAISRYACFYTFGGLVEGRVRDDMADCLDQEPEAVLAVSRLSNAEREIDRFVQALGAS